MWSVNHVVLDYAILQPYVQAVFPSYNAKIEKYPPECLTHYINMQNQAFSDFVVHFFQNVKKWRF